MGVRSGSWFTPPGELMSAPGVERALAGGVSILKAMNMAQMAVMVAAAAHLSPRPRLEIAVATVVGISGVIFIGTSLRSRRLVPWAVGLDAGVIIATVYLAPLFQARQVTAWSEWPMAVSFLAATAACVTLARLPAVLVVVGLLGGSGSWVLWNSDPAVQRMAFTSWVPYLGFSIGGALFLRYLRSLALLADERGEAIRRLEEERTRRILHTPYRLVNELAGLLGEKVAAADDSSDPGGLGVGAAALQRARLAEALAAAHEIEAIVRGTEPASANLAADMRRVQEQFVDLPLVMDVAGVTDDLPPVVVLRIREAVRSILQNVRLHAGAGEVIVLATADHDVWSVSIHDDGCGFDPAGVRLGVGLREAVFAAVREIGGVVELSSRPGQGTLVRLSGPVDAPLHPASTARDQVVIDDESLATIARSRR